MTRDATWLAGAILAALAWTGYGCAGSGDSSAPTENSSDAAGDHSNHDHGDGDHDHADDGDDAEANIDKLPEADRALARTQKICPVSGEPLGSMGVPLKVAVDGREVFVCCDGCTEELLKDPETHLAKIDAAAGQTESP